MLTLIITFLLTVFTDLVVAVNVGVILAMLFFIRNMSQYVNIGEQKAEELIIELAGKGLSLPPDTIVYAIQGPFFFGAAEKIERTLAVTYMDPKNIIFRLKDVPFMDMTGLETFDELIKQYHKRGIKIYICEANKRVGKKLLNAKIINGIKETQIFETLTDAINAST